MVEKIIHNIVDVDKQSYLRLRKHAQEIVTASARDWNKLLLNIATSPTLGADYMELF